jgi:cyclase
MLKQRIIPVILLRNGVIVQSRLFKRYQSLGSPTAAVKRLSSWNSDELIYLDISSTNVYNLGRDDLNYPDFSSIEDIIKLIAKTNFIPLTFGGKIRNVNDIRNRLKNGADKITLNTAAIENPELINICAKEFGKQCIVISIDAKKTENNSYKVYKGGKIETNISPFELAKNAENYGAGEILINSIDNDGAGNGFDLDLIQKMINSVNIPVIALGGAGKWEHFEEVLKTGVSAVAAANIFQHSENSVYNLKKHLFDNGFNVREPLNLMEEKNNL